ncbi:hypothetical protein ACFS27_26105 [Promicromonospora vindobonensis]|uniref:Secreted protein n=1 Tax=Promicromonospora vindobonensis TaxID=195748 RepID=A0ABW5VZH1_9MICO
MHKYRTSKLAAAALAIPLLLVALTACGTTDDSLDASGSTDGFGATDESFEEWRLAYTSCMREQGVDMPDPGPDGGIEPSTDDGFMAADKACSEKLGSPPAPSDGDEPVQSDEERQAAMLKLAACFRDNGVDLPDPKPGELVNIPDDIPEEVFEKCVSNDGINGAGASGDS